MTALCEICGVGDSKPKHYVCYGQNDTRGYHNDCFHLIRPEGCAICGWGTASYDAPRKGWWRR